MASIMVDALSNLQSQTPLADSSDETFPTFRLTRLDVQTFRLTRLDVQKIFKAAVPAIC